MTVTAVVLDIGGVLEVIDDTVFPGPWPARLGLTDAAFAERLEGLDGDPVLGEVTWPDVVGHWRQRLGLDEGTAHALGEDFWRWYVGTLDRPLVDWFAGQRPDRLTAILSNSGPGARERERHHGFEGIVDELVYSDEVGLAKPDAAVYALVTARLGVRPEEVLFLDDVAANVDAARAAGWQAVLHEDTGRSIAEMERLIAGA